MTDSVPDLDDLQQQEEPEGLIVVPVKIVESEQLRVHNLPNRRAILRNVIANGTDVQQIVGGNLRRQKLTVWAVCADVGTWLWIGTDRADVESNTAARLHCGLIGTAPAPVQLVMNHAAPVWVRSSSAQLVNVSFLAEEWAD